MDCSLPGSSVHGIFQARVLEWAAITFSRGSSQPRDRTQVSHTVGRHFTVWATTGLRIDAFELWCWRRLLKVPWTAMRSKQSILKETSSEYSLERLMLKLKLQYFGYLVWRTNSFEKTLIWGKTEGRRRRGQQSMRWLDGITTGWTWVGTSLRSWWWTGKPVVLQSMGSQIVRHNWATELKVILESKKPCKNVSFEETSPHRNVKSVSSSPPGASMRSFSLRGIELHIHPIALWVVLPFFVTIW